MSPTHSTEQAYVVFLNCPGMAFGAELTHIAVRAEKQWLFLLSGEILYVVDHLFHLRDESGEAHLHNIEFFPIDDLPVGWHNTRCFPHNCGLVGEQ
jgi:hypothetical protein